MNFSISVKVANNGYIVSCAGCDSENGDHVFKATERDDMVAFVETVVTKVENVDH